jgi:hypothetical protein
VALILSQNVASNLIQNATSKQAIPLISQNLASINQAVSIKQAISASYFSNIPVIQSINVRSVIQHLIICLITTISTLPARGIG